MNLYNFIFDEQRSISEEIYKIGKKIAVRMYELNFLYT